MGGWGWHPFQLVLYVCGAGDHCSHCTVWVGGWDWHLAGYVEPHKTFIQQCTPPLKAGAHELLKTTSSLHSGKTLIAFTKLDLLLSPCIWPRLSFQHPPYCSCCSMSQCGIHTPTASRPPLMPPSTMRSLCECFTFVENQHCAFQDLTGCSGHSLIQVLLVCMSHCTFVCSFGLLGVGHLCACIIDSGQGVNRWLVFPELPLPLHQW